MSVLTAHGIAPADIPAKLESITFGCDVTVGGAKKHTLFIANDNDFIGKRPAKASPGVLAVN